MKDAVSEPMSGDPTMRQRFTSVFLANALLCLAFGTVAASACPMCKAANEAPQPDGTSMADANLRPRAYMYSIFFMMGMPPIAGGAIAFAICRDVKRANAASTDPASLANS